jgi:hypothetical protein
MTSQNVEERLKEISERLFTLEGKPDLKSPVIKSVLVQKSPVKIEGDASRKTSFLWKIVKYGAISLVIFIVFNMIRNKIRGTPRKLSGKSVPFNNSSQRKVSPVPPNTINSLEELLKRKEEKQKAPKIEEIIEETPNKMK